MSDGVENVGRRLLESTNAVGLDDLLAHIRALHRHAYPKPIFGLEQLDKLLHERHEAQFDPNGLLLQDQEQFRSRITEQPRATLIELTSAQPWAGKSTFLSYLTGTMLLPQSFDGINIDGKESVVVIIDVEAEFDLTLLHDNMKRRVERSTSPHLSESSIKTVLEQALSRIYLLRPKSLSSLISTLVELPVALLSMEHLSRYPVGLIAIDGLTTYYWSNRLSNPADSVPRALLSALAKLSSYMDEIPEKPQRETKVAVERASFANMVKQLQLLSSKFDCPVLVTTWDPTSFSSFKISVTGRHQRREEPRPSDNAPTLNPAFPILPTLRLNLSQTHSVRDNSQTMQQESLSKFKVTEASAGDAKKRTFSFLVGHDGVPIFEENMEMGDGR